MRRIFDRQMIHEFSDEEIMLELCRRIRLLKFLRYVTALQPSEMQAIPPTSILREFLGGQTLS